MKKRSVEILQKLLKFPHRGLDLQKLLSDYHITEKTCGAIYRKSLILRMLRLFLQTAMFCASKRARTSRR